MIYYISNKLLTVLFVVVVVVIITVIIIRNCFMRMLFNNTGCALSTVSILWYFITALGMPYYFLLY